MGDAGDGRLELDDLGSVIEHASSLDATRSIDVLEGSGARTWGERLESVGMTPWLRRHRVALAVTAGALLVGAGLVTGWERSRPPPLDTSPAAAVEDASITQFGGSGVFLIDNDTLLTAYLFSHERAGTTSALVGVAGPGIRASTTRGPAQDEPPLQDGAREVVAVIGCDDPDAIVPNPDDYRVLVAQTDAYGRTQQVPVPMPAGSAQQWSQNVQATCLQVQLPTEITATSQTVQTDPAHRTVTVDLALRNASSHAVTLGVGGGNGRAQYTASAMLPLAAGSTGSMSYVQRVIDCSLGRFDEASLPEPDRNSARPIDGANLSASLDESTNGYSATLSVVWDRQVAAALKAFYATVCSGMPAASARVVSAGRAPVDPSVEFTTGGDPSLVPLRMTVDVATSADRVLAGDPTPLEDLLNGATSTITSGAARAGGGHARVTLDWLAPCSGVTGPPTLALTLGEGSRTWPMNATVNQRALTAAYVAACPLLLPNDLADNGWEALPPAP